LNGEIFYSLKEAQVVIERWRVEYNTRRPHSALGYRPPAPAAIAPQFAALRSPTAPCEPQIAQRDFLMYPLSQPLVQKLGLVRAMMKMFDFELRKRWVTFSLYEKFEHLIISLLTFIIAAIVAVATWQLILHTVVLVRGHLLDPRDSQIFQTVFGMVLTVLIAMEFKHSLLVVTPHQRDIVQIRSVVLIALLALVRKFIILDIYQTQPLVVFALAAASLSLGIVFWLVRNQDEAKTPPQPASGGESIERSLGPHAADGSTNI
jgi:uncharacterized membrane protein (DUF373 family)